MEDPESCPTCKANGERIPFPRTLHISKSRVQHAEFNHGLGKVVKNQYHKEEICKRMGVVEVGNDYASGEKMQTKFEAERAIKREKEWDKI